MNLIRRHGLYKYFTVFLLCLAGVTVATAQTAAPASQRIRGQIISLDGTDLQMRADSGQNLKIKLTSGYRLSAVSRGELSKVAANAYIGVAAMPQPDGTLKAIDIRVFPEAMRGTGEGHRPMDAAAGSTMTNATVSAVSSGAPGETITNATVSDVGAGSQLRKVTVKYTGGEKTVLISPDTPVLMIETANKAMLVSGARIVVSVSTLADGSLQGDRVSVGLNGAVPPL